MVGLLFLLLSLVGVLIIALKETIGKKIPELANALVFIMIAMDGSIIYIFSKLNLENSNIALAIILSCIVKVIFFILSEIKQKK
jgi:hypothetical protein